MSALRARSPRRLRQSSWRRSRRTAWRPPMESIWMPLAQSPTSTRGLAMDGARDMFLRARPAHVPSRRRSLTPLLEAIALWRTAGPRRSVSTTGAMSRFDFLSRDLPAAPATLSTPSTGSSFAATTAASVVTSPEWGASPSFESSASRGMHDDLRRAARQAPAPSQERASRVERKGKPKR